MKKILSVVSISIIVMSISCISLFAKTYSGIKRHSQNKDVSLSASLDKMKWNGKYAYYEGESAIRWYGKTPFNADELTLENVMVVQTTGTVTKDSTKIIMERTTSETTLKEKFTIKNKWNLRSFMDHEFKSTRNVSDTDFSVSGSVKIGKNIYSLSLVPTVD